MLFTKIKLKISINIKLFLWESTKLIIIGSKILKLLDFKFPIVLLKNKNKKYIYILINNSKTIGLNVKHIKILLFNLLKFSNFYYKKILNLIGTGYKIFLIVKNNETILNFKLGYSHTLFIKIPTDIIIKIPKPTKIIIMGSDKTKVLQLSTLIKTFKLPDVYKGKGFLYEFERLNLKKGKKL